MRETTRVYRGDKRPRAILHLTLTLLTCGLWLPFWVFFAIRSRRRIVATMVTRRW